MRGEAELHRHHDLHDCGHGEEHAEQGLLRSVLRGEHQVDQAGDAKQAGEHGPHQRRDRAGGRRGGVAADCGDRGRAHRPEPRGRSSAEDVGVPGGAQH